MGNSNSSGGGGHRSHGGRHHHPNPHQHHPSQQQWTSHSLENPEQRNRMKRGYFPPRPYIGHPGLPQPQKVLPSNAISATPSKLLKPTSNGAILHGGGTISGRKLSEMTEMDRKRSTISCPAVDYPIGGLSSGRSTPNLVSVGLGGGQGFRRNGSSGSRGGSSRDYGSEPDLREVGMEPCHPGNCPGSRNPSPLDDSRSVESPLPNSFTLISESPAKKQIRSRKKSKAPPPPGHPACCPPDQTMIMPPNAYIVHQNGHHSPMQMVYPPMPQPYILQQRHFLPDEGKKKSRLFKTKAESKSAANSPGLRSPPSSELIFPVQHGINHSQFGGLRGAPMRASLDANRLLSNRNEKERSSQHSNSNRPASSQLIERESKMMMKDKKVKVTTERDNNKSSGGGGAIVSNGRLTSSSGGPLCSPKENNAEVTNKKISSHAQERIEARGGKVPVVGSSSSGGGGSRNIAGSGGGNESSSGLILNNRQVPNNNNNNVTSPQHKKGKAPTTNGLVNGIPNVGNGNNGHKIKNDGQHESFVEQEKKKFYFGMDMGTFKNKNGQQNGKNKISNGNHGAIQSPPGLNDDLSKEISRRKLVKQIEEEIKEEDNIKANNNKARALKNQINNGKVPLKQKNSNNLRSESDSDGLHRRQDSGNFELNDKPKPNNKSNKIQQQNQKGGRGGGGGGDQRESSSDLSSSDLDVPLVVTRPTLPQKRPDLPRFSPTAAWRALDSPSRVSISGRSYSSEDGLHGDSFISGNGGKIRGYTRPSAPPRVSQERSGDSGISAGDAGSPANIIIPLASEDFSSSSPVLNMPLNNNLKGHHHVKGNKSADRMMKCWVPEQDLDESSSEFEQDVLPLPQSQQTDGLRPLTPSKNGGAKFAVNSSRLFEGKRAAAVVSDSDSKYFSSSGGMELNESNSSTANNNRRFYSRSTKSKLQDHQNKRLSNPTSPTGSGVGASASGNVVKYSSKVNKSSNTNSNGFVGLDTNWFLSRSEPNSLHCLGAEEQEIIFPPRKSSVQSREVIIGRKKRMQEQDGDDEFECELHLSDEDEEAGFSDNNNNNDLNRNKRNNNIPSLSSKKNKKESNGKQAHQSSEIGYGPSNMNFKNRSKFNKTYDQQDGDDVEVDYEDFDEEDDEDDDDEDDANTKRNKLNLKADEEDIEEELMRDDLFDYLDQYEEGEFEREQELTGSIAATATVAGSGISSNMNNITTVNAQTAKRNGTSDTQSHSQIKPLNNANNNGNNSRPFSHHIMYLPSYDSRKINHFSSSHQRRAKSVDHLDSCENTLYIRRGRQMSPPVRNGYAGESEDGRGRSKIKVRPPPVPNTKPKAVRKQSAPCYMSEGLKIHQEGDIPTLNDKPMSLEEAERRLQNKKKFKFQSTLRVQERRKIEQELTKEANQQEEERLREIEAMKKVEEEFQKKRAKEKLEAQANAALANLNELPIHMVNHGHGNGHGNTNVSRIDLSSSGGMSPALPGSRGMSPIGGGRNNHHFIPQQQEMRKSSYPFPPGGRRKEALSHQQSTSSSGSSGGPNMSKRQEPEGAPAPNSLCNSSLGSGSQDLRKELISASRKRNALAGSREELQQRNPNHTQQTQELSEYRQETRQYCDYRSRPGRQQSLSPARFVQSSSSDIFPISSRRKGGAGSSYSGGSKVSTRSTIHPEVVCDIPVKPVPYMVNASRLGGSNMNLVSEERPNSILGSMNNLSSPSSVISDNYRKDWAHHQNRGGGSIIQGGRASSVISLHSAPGFSSTASDLNFRNSTSDLSRIHSNNLHGQSSPKFFKEKITRQYSASPTSTSPVPPRGISSNDSVLTDNFHSRDKSRASPLRIMSRSNTTVISIGAPLPTFRNGKKSSNSGMFQAQPYKVKNYRPVAFKPSNPSTTTAVN